MRKGRNPKDFAPFAISGCRLFDDIVFLEYFLDAFEGTVNLLDGVSCHQAEADESILRRNCWRNYWVDKDAFLKQVAGNSECLVVVADKQWDDWC